MKSEVNKWIDMLREAWSKLIEDYRILGSFERSGYGHMQEEDLRCFLFCKVMDELRSRDEFSVDLHADVSVLGKRVDLALGLGEDKPDEAAWKLGVEIKRTADIQGIRGDLEKLRFFIESRKIEAGAFLAMAKHSADLKTLFTQVFNAEYKLEEKDTGNNNFTNWVPIKIDTLNVEWDTLFLVLRRL